ncbi:MAG: anti-sigma regulatory factor [Desertifilum sp. SIO1I2]|nr:anti-sigma regulatory factor [Desertifilum sp. SIO1I2]
MIAISQRPVSSKWSTISFASTLYLCPVLDLLLAGVPNRLQAEVRLGLQEALVNAAKHGNNLDPSKKVLVRFSIMGNTCWWVISDQGSGIPVDCCCSTERSEQLPHQESECGRGLFILHQVFDRVEWNPDERELKLGKLLSHSSD